MNLQEIVEKLEKDIAALQEHLAVVKFELGRTRMMNQYLESLMEKGDKRDQSI